MKIFKLTTFENTAFIRMYVGLSVAGIVIKGRFFTSLVSYTHSTILKSRRHVGGILGVNKERIKTLDLCYCEL